VRQLFEQTFVTGDVAVNAKSFGGLDELTDAAQSLSMGANGGSLHSVWLSTLTLLIDKTPDAGESMDVFWTKLHTIDGSSSTVPARFEDVIAAGAGATRRWNGRASRRSRVNVGGRDVWREHLVCGQERLAEFQRSLARHGRPNAVRARRL